MNQNAELNGPVYNKPIQKLHIAVPCEHNLPLSLKVGPDMLQVSCAIVEGACVGWELLLHLFLEASGLLYPLRFLQVIICVRIIEVHQLIGSATALTVEYP